jgi:hypothetical protein
MKVWVTFWRSTVTEQTIGPVETLIDAGYGLEMPDVVVGAPAGIVIGLLLQKATRAGSGPGTHEPPEQTSPRVQTFPSEHGAALLAWTQPDAGVHESSVQGLASSQLTVV